MVAREREEKKRVSPSSAPLLSSLPPSLPLVCDKWRIHAKTYCCYSGCIWLPSFSHCGVFLQVVVVAPGHWCVYCRWEVMCVCMRHPIAEYFHDWKVAVGSVNGCGSSLHMGISLESGTEEAILELDTQSCKYTIRCHVAQCHTTGSQLTSENRNIR